MQPGLEEKGDAKPNPDPKGAHIFSANHFTHQQSCLITQNCTHCRILRDHQTLSSLLSNRPPREQPIKTSLRRGCRQSLQYPTLKHVLSRISDVETRALSLLLNTPHCRSLSSSYFPYATWRSPRGDVTMPLHWVQGNSSSTYQPIVGTLLGRNELHDTSDNLHLFVFLCVCSLQFLFIMLSAFIASGLAVLSTLPWTSAFNNPAGVEIWCGKAYRPA